MKAIEKDALHPGSDGGFALLPGERERPREVLGRKPDAVEVFGNAAARGDDQDAARVRIFARGVWFVPEASGRGETRGGCPGSGEELPAGGVRSVPRQFG